MHTERQEIILSVSCMLRSIHVTILFEFAMLTGVQDTHCFLPTILVLFPIFQCRFQNADVTSGYNISYQSN